MIMIKVIYKVFWIWNFDKEEQWLNEMSAKGFQLRDVGFCRYTFEQGIPGEYIYRLELLDTFPRRYESRRYIDFVEGTGAEHIASLGKWVYFRKKAGAGGFDLFSDIDSRIKHLRRMLWLTGILSVLNLLNGLNSLHIGITHNVRGNLIVGIFALTVDALFLYGLFALLKKVRKLRKEKILHE